MKDRAPTYAEIMATARRAREEIERDWPDWKIALAATLTADEVAAMTGLCRKAVYTGAAAGEIPCRRVGRRFIFVRSVIERWLACSDGERSHVAAGGQGRPAAAG